MPLTHKRRKEIREHAATIIKIQTDYLDEILAQDYDDPVEHAHFRYCVVKEFSKWVGPPRRKT